MSRVRVVMVGLLSSVVCGVMCGWVVAASLVFTGEVGFSSAAQLSSTVMDAVLGVFLFFVVAALWGGATGAALGLGPTTVVVLLWGVLQARLGPDGAVRAAGLLVGAVVLVELLGVVDEDGWWIGPGPTTPVLCAAFAGWYAFTELRSELRASQARLARRTY